MAIYKTRWFDRWSDKEGLTDRSLCTATKEMKDGLFDADLGSGLFKKRVAKQGKGKSGGFRTLVATNKGDRWVFVYGFSKNTRSNIDKDEEEALKKYADEVLSYTQTAINKLKNEGKLIEVECNAENKVANT